MALATTVKTYPHHQQTHPIPTPIPQTTKISKTYHLRPNPTLHQRPAVRVPVDRLDVIIEARDQAAHGQDPEDDAEGEGEAFFDVGGLMFEMEGDEDCGGHDGQVGR